jgi:hypothetical protein
MDDQGAEMSLDVRRAPHVRVRRASCVRSTVGCVLRVSGIAFLVAVISGHVGSPDVFFTGTAGPYDLRVIIRPPEVVPGVARVTVRASAEVSAVSIRPVFWRAGSRGAPSADETRRLQGTPRSQTFEGSLWLMARGAYSVDVIVEGTRGQANVLVPVASVATGRLDMSPGLTALLIALGFLLCAGLLNIVYKGAGESLIDAGADLDAETRRRARRVAAIAIPLVALGLLGGARWWRAVDRAYEQTIYRPSPLKLSLQSGLLLLQATDTVFQPPRRPSALIADHGKLMHLFLVRADDARGFAHLHPQAVDTTAIPPFVTVLPQLPIGAYRVFADVVHETGFERTLVGSIVLDESSSAPATTDRQQIIADADDAWFVGDPSLTRTARLADSSTMTLEIEPNGVIQAGREETLRISVRDPNGEPARLQPYLGMTAHGVIVRVDGAVFVHLHPMGTVTKAAQDAFLARDRGDTTESGRLRFSSHGAHAPTAAPALSQSSFDEFAITEFPYAFPRSGSYRLFVQVKRSGRILTGAFAITVAEAAGDTR